MPDRPPLYLHAGFPKCATTALQGLMMADGHRITRAMGLTWIGRGMQPWADGPPVSEIMYQPDQTRAALTSLPLDPTARYLMSSEALSNHFDALHPAWARFDIRRIVLTIRLPIATRLSEYCFSGWLTKQPHQIKLHHPTDTRSHVITRLQSTAPLALCPIEPQGLATRVLTHFGAPVPKGAEDLLTAKGASNPSSPPALAATLAEMLSDRLAKPIPGPLRSTFTNMARIYRGPPEFAEALPEAFVTEVRQPAFIKEALETYRAILSLGGTSPEDTDAALSQSHKTLTALTQRPTPSPDLKAAMRTHANWTLRKVQEDRPEIRDLFKPEFQVG